MKKNIAGLSLSLSLLFVGCAKDLDKQPLAQVVNTNFYKTKNDAIAAVNAAYDPLQWGFNNRAFTNEFLFGDIVSDDAEKGGEGLGDQAYIEDLAEFRGTPSNIALLGLWGNLYQGIYRANLVILNVPTIAMDPLLRNRIVGEARFLRAYYYFYLVRMFGGVPLITQPLEPSQYKQPKASKEKVYAQIEADLMDAAKAVPEKNQYAAEDMGRVTAGAVNSLLVKVYVYESLWNPKWDLAEPLALKVINSGMYSLEPNYKKIFTTAGENGPESIFEIQHMSSNDGWGNANEGFMGNILQGSRGNGFGWGFDCPTKDFVNAFEANDPRLAATVILEKDTVNGAPADNSASPTKMAARKYVIPVSQRPSIGDPNSNGPSNQRVIRYADLLLMYAEAAWNNKNEAAALLYLNKVRARARNGKAGILPDKTSSGAALLQDIWNERRVELGLEGIRFFDIVRQGRAGKILRATKKTFSSATATGLAFKDGVNEVFPIPQTEIDLSGGLTTQNQGY